MTVSVIQEVYEKPDYYCVDVDYDDEFPESATTRSSTTTSLTAPAPEQIQTQESTFADRWLFLDTVVQLIDELAASGRIREAAAVRRVLGHDDDEAAMRAYVSNLWAEDWNSPEDSIYDE